MNRRCVRAVIRGRVQRVGFRDYSRRQAGQLGLDGWVRNLPDGSVEACICGDPEKVRAMCQRLACGPAGAAVADLEVAAAEPDGVDRGFTVR